MGIGENYYWLIIVNDYSRYTWTLFIIIKNDTLITFKKLANVLQNENNYNICVIKSDHGGEFQNEKLDQFCEKHGIKHNF